MYHSFSRSSPLFLSLRDTLSLSLTLPISLFFCLSSGTSPVNFFPLTLSPSFFPLLISPSLSLPTLLLSLHFALSLSLSLSLLWCTILYRLFHVAIHDTPFLPLPAFLSLSHLSLSYSPVSFIFPHMRFLPLLLSLQISVSLSTDRQTDR